MNIALVAHDARKQELIDWCKFNAEVLLEHNLYATGTTAKKIKIALNELYGGANDKTSSIAPLLSGPLGGDQQIGAMIAEGKVDVLIFFCDNLITQGHHNDVSALVRLASLYNIAFATNRTTADMIITSPLFGNPNYTRLIPEAIDQYKNRKI